MKSFNTLTETEKAERLAAYAAQDAALGTVTKLARLVKPAKINTLTNGAKQAIVRLAIYDNETKETTYDNFFAYIAEGKESLEQFYAGLNKGQLVSCQYKENNGFKNIYTLMIRNVAEKVAVETVAADADIPFVTV